jgi:threonine/homoserine/homoserine lactone efflux protein
MNLAITKGILFGLFMAISVGPTIFAILKYSISYGYKAGISYITGVSISDILFVFMANYASSFLQKAESYTRQIGIIGALLLIVMGTYGTFKKLKVQRTTEAISPVGIGGLLKIATSGFFMNSLNPGVIITWLAMSAAVSLESDSYRFTVFAIALGVVLGSDVLKVFGANKVRSVLTPRNTIKLQRISALCLLGTGIFLLIKFLFFYTAIKAHI